MIGARARKVRRIGQQNKTEGDRDGGVWWGGAMRAVTTAGPSASALFRIAHSSQRPL